MKMKDIPHKKGEAAHNTLIAYRLCDIEDCCCDQMVNSLCRSISLQFIHEHSAKNDNNAPHFTKLDAINSFITKYFFKKYTSVVFVECRCTRDMIVIDLDLIDSSSNYIIFNERIIRRRDQPTTRPDRIENFTHFLRSWAQIPRNYLSDATACSVKLGHIS